MKVRFAVAPGRSLAGNDDLDTMVDVLESSGFDGIWLSDVTLTPVIDPLVGLAFAAGRTKRLKLGANLVPLGRNPFLLAKSLGQLDRISNGRLLLSLVPGIDQPGERAALGATGSDRGTLLETMLELLRAWWSGEAVTHTASSWSFEALRLPALPLQNPLEVWLGGNGPRALERAGRMSDGWLGAAMTPAEAVVARQKIVDAASDAGREIDPEHFGMSIAYSKETPQPALLERIRAQRIRTRQSDIDPTAFMPVGVEGLRSMIRSYTDAGVSKFVLGPIGTVSWVDETRWLAEAVLDLQT